MGLLVYKVADFSFTAEREQYRTICEMLKGYYANKAEICLFVVNYNLYDSELDGILIKNDAVISIEFKNYGGVVTAVENGCWTLSDGTIVKGGSRKNPYQQAKINHINLKQGLVDGMILPHTVVRNVPALVIFNQPTQIHNQLSGRVRSWLHITDNEHFLQKVSDITESCTDLSNEEIIGLIGKLNLQEEWLDREYSDDSLLEISESESTIDATIPLPFDTVQESIDIQESCGPIEIPLQISKNVHHIDPKMIRVSSDRIDSLGENEIFVFGSNIAGKHIGGAAKQAFQKFGAQWGIGEGLTGRSYAIPTMHGGIDVIAPHIQTFVNYAKENPQYTFLVTKIGCGIAKFTPEQIAPLFSDAANLNNVYLPAEFWLYINKGQL